MGNVFSGIHIQAATDGTLIQGGDGDDTLRSHNDDDTLLGGAGNDLFEITGRHSSMGTVDGGTGDDVFHISLDEGSNVSVSGGAGSDSFGFYYYYGRQCAYTVLDFTPGPGGDRIDLLSQMRGAADDADRNHPAYYSGGNPFQVDIAAARLQQQGADTLVQFKFLGYSDIPFFQTMVILRNTLASALTADNFVAGLSPFGAPTVVAPITGSGAAESLSGDLFDDTIRGGGGADTIDGQGGNDLLIGDDQAGPGSNEILLGRAGNDSLYGNGGNDWLNGGGGDDILHGGAGNDSLSGAYGSDLVDGGDGDDLLINYDMDDRGNDTLLGGAGNDRILFRSVVFGAGHHSVIDGGAGDDTINGLRIDGPDNLLEASGGEGRDTFAIPLSLSGLYVIDDFASGSGGDLLDINTLFEALLPGQRLPSFYVLSNPFSPEQQYARLLQSGVDTLLQFDPPDYAGNRSGFRTVVVLKNVLADSLGSSNFIHAIDPAGGPVTGESLAGGSGADSLTGWLFDDTLVGGDGDDTLDGGPGNDYLSGGDGNDSLIAGLGSDSLDGGAGDDTLIGGNGGTKLLLGGAGNDLLSLDGDGSLRGGDGDDELFLGYACRGEADAGAGDDRIHLSLSYDAAAAVLVSGAGGSDTYVVTGLDIFHQGGELRITDFKAGDGGDRFDGDVLTAGLIASGRYFGGNPFSTGMLKLVQDGTDALLQLRISREGEPAVYRSFLTLAQLSVADLTAFNFGGRYSADGSVSGGQLLQGSEQADRLNGGAYDDTLYGGAGADSLDGGYGSDLLDGGSGDDLLRYPVIAGDSTLRGGAGNDRIEVAAARHRVALQIDGGAGDDHIELELASRMALRIDTGAGRDTIAMHYSEGGFEVRVSDFSAGSGGDRIDLLSVLKRSVGPRYSGNNPFAADLMRLVQDGEDAVLLYDIANLVYPRSNSPVFITLLRLEHVAAASLSADNFIGGYGPELLAPTGVVLAANGAATLEGSLFGDRLTGSAADDYLNGNGGDDTLDGGAGADHLNGGAGSDTYVVDQDGDVIVEWLGAAGTDMVIVAIAAGQYVLPDAIENALLAPGSRAGLGGNDGANLLTGNVGANRLQGGAGNDTLIGGAGNDTLDGGAGNDVIDAGSGSDRLDGGDGNDSVLVRGNFGSYQRIVVDATTTLLVNGLTGEALSLRAIETVVFADGSLGIAQVRSGISSSANDTLNGGVGADFLAGGAGKDQLNGGAGDDTLDGGAGNDKLAGGGGDDVYLVDAAGDTVTEFLNEGRDRVDTGLAAYTLGQHVEELRYTGGGAFSGKGNALANVIVGGGGNDKLDGAAGNDSLYGGAGNDSLSGGDGDDSLVAGSGSDSIDGGAGSDTLLVLAGFAHYAVRRPNAGDTVLFNAASGAQLTLRGVETVQFADVSKTIEELWRGLPSDGDDALAGSAGADTLGGGLGNDTLSGGLGDDVYIVNSAGDLVVEQADAGTDSISVAFKTAALYTLTAHVENGTATGTAAIGLNGNGLDNLLTGNAAANVLNGGAGNDTLDGGASKDRLSGGTGDDVYRVDAGDVVTELPGEGVDRVDTRLASYTLGANVEQLRYTGTAAFTGTGNGLDNLIAGGAGKDVLNGGAGNDSLVGGAGNDKLAGGNGADLLDGGAGSDSLSGGAGADRFLLDQPGGADSVSDFVSGSDTLLLDAAALGLGNGDRLLDGAVLRGAAGGFASGAELVLFSQNAAALTAAAAASVIVAADNAYAVGDKALFAIDNGVSSQLYLFIARDADARVSAEELSLLVTLTGTPATLLADYLAYG